MPVAARSRSGVRRDDAGILAAHLRDARTRIRAARERAEDVHAGLVRAGERHAGSARVLHECVADRAARTHQIVEHAGRQPRVAQTIREQAARPWRFARAFSTTVLPVTSAAATGPPASANGKLNGSITTHTPYGFITLRLRDTRIRQRIVRQRVIEVLLALEVVAVDVEEVRRLLHFAERFHAVLADLERERGADVDRRAARSAARLCAAGACAPAAASRATSETPLPRLPLRDRRPRCRLVRTSRAASRGRSGCASRVRAPCRHSAPSMCSECCGRAASAPRASRRRSAHASPAADRTSWSKSVCSS